MDLPIDLLEADTSNYGAARLIVRFLKTKQILVLMEKYL